MDDYHVVVGERVEFEIEVSEEGAHVMWSVNILILRKVYPLSIIQYVLQ